MISNFINKKNMVVILMALISIESLINKCLTISTFPLTIAAYKAVSLKKMSYFIILFKYINSKCYSKII